MKAIHWTPKEIIAHHAKIGMPPNDSLFDAPAKATNTPTMTATTVEKIVIFLATVSVLY